jgi:hypothetical protein
MQRSGLRIKNLYAHINELHAQFFIDKTEFDAHFSFVLADAKVILLASLAFYIIYGPFNLCSMY